MSNKNKHKSKGFSGSFGGAKNAASRTQTPVSGRSTSTAYILGAVSEGSVEGPIEWEKGVYLDEVPIQNSNGTYNFKGHEFHFREGTQSQPVIDFISGERPFVATPTGLPNYNNTPQIFTYNNSDIGITTLFFEVVIELSVPLDNIFEATKLENGSFVTIRIPGKAIQIGMPRIFPGIKYRLSYTFNQDDSGWIQFPEEIIGGDDFETSWIYDYSGLPQVYYGSYPVFCDDLDGFVYCYYIDGDGNSVTWNGENAPINYNELFLNVRPSSTNRIQEINFGTPKTFVKIKIEKLPLNGEIRSIRTFQGTQFDYGYTLVDQTSDYKVNLNLHKYWGTSVGFNKQVSLEIPVQVEVKNNLEITRQFTSVTIQSIKVKLAFTLQRFDDQGNTFGEIVYFRIQVRQPGGNFETRVNSFFEGRYPSPTEVDYLIPNLITPQNPNDANFQIRVIKDTPEADNPNTQRQITWVSYTQVTFTTLNYANTAIAGFRFNTEYFQRIPSIAIKLAGRKIQIPSNATIKDDLSGKPEVRYLTFQGQWNGTFQTPSQACSDPAWILYDLLKHTRYGLGNYIDTTQIDKWGLYEISKYCNELIPDGSGGLEPRFSCNIKLEGKVEAYQVIQNLVSIFRGFAYWQAGAVSFVADKPNAVVHQFTQADIEEGSFSYSRSGLKSRKTIAVVSYLNPIDFFKKAVEVVEDPIGIQKWGIREMELEAIACTSRGQARRAGVAALLTNRLEQESVTFKARAFAAFVKPGDLIRIYDSKRTAARYAGIIKAATALTVTLDSPVNLPSGTTYKITVTTSTLQIPELEGGNNLADPAQKQKVRFKIAEATITNNGNNLTVLELQSPGFGSDIPPAESNWVIQGGDLSNTIYRVINRSPVQDSIEGMHEILAVEYNSSKYAFIDDMTFL